MHLRLRVESQPAGWSPTGHRTLTRDPPPLFGVGRDLCRAHDINEPFHRDEVNRGGDGHGQQPGGRYLPAWIPRTHHYPLVGRAGQRACRPDWSAKNRGAHRARHYGTSQFARNKKLIAAQSRRGHRTLDVLLPRNSREDRGRNGGRTKSPNSGSEDGLRAKCLIWLVGAARFELATPSPPDWCANRAALRSADAAGL